MTDKTARPTGQAYNKAQTHIYTWFSDGTVTRHAFQRHPFKGGYVISDLGTLERVEPAPAHNLTDFWAFVPVEGAEAK